MYTLSRNTYINFKNKNQYPKSPLNLPHFPLFYPDTLHPYHLLLSHILPFLRRHIPIPNILTTYPSLQFQIILLNPLRHSVVYKWQIQHVFDTILPVVWVQRTVIEQACFPLVPHRVEELLVFVYSVWRAVEL